MTNLSVTESPTRAQYKAAAGDTVFDIPFKFLQDKDVKVYLTPAGQDPDDDNDILTYSTDYTLAGAGVDTGSGVRKVTLTTPASANDVITIRLDMAIERLTDYGGVGDFLADTINTEQTRVFLIMNQLNELITSRMLRFKETAYLNGVSTKLPEPSAGEAPVWNSAGNALVNAPVDTDAIQTAAAAADASRVAAEAARDDLRGQYYGAAASDPTTDPNGNAPTAGDRYYNTTTGALRVYDGSAWTTPATSAPVQSDTEDFASGRVVTTDTLKKVRNALAVAHVREWKSRTSAADNQWRSVAWSPELGLFVAVSSTGTGNRVMTSPDGINWTIRTSAADNDWWSVAWSPELGLFAAVANTGTGNRVMTSPDGINWTIRTSAADNNWNSVVWSSYRSIFVAVASSGVGNRVMISSDGINWTTQASASDDWWMDVTWSPNLGMFVAVGVAGAVMTSPDGISWTSRSAAASNNWNGVAWSPELGLFVAVASSGTGNRVMTSPDGVNWTARSAEDNQWWSVAWSPGLGLFVAVSSDGTGNRVMTSPDGINWTTRASAADNTWQSVTWSPELGLFASVSVTGIGNRVMTSM